MNRLIRLPRAAVHLFVIWCFSPFSYAWAARLRRRYCAGIGAVLPAAVIITEVRFRWPHIFSFVSLSATVKGMEAELRQLAVGPDVKALLQGTFRLKTLRAGSIQLRADRAAPAEERPKSGGPAATGISPRVYRQAFETFRRSIGLVPQNVLISSLDIAFHRQKCSLKEISCRNGVFGFHLFAGRNADGCNISGVLDASTCRIAFEGRALAVGGQQRYLISGPFSAEFCSSAQNVLVVNVHAGNVSLKWPVLAAEPVNIDKTSAALHFRLNGESFVLEDTSVVRVNGFGYFLYACHAFAPENIFRVIIDTGETTPGVLLKALPSLKKLLPHSFTGRLPPVNISFAASIDNPYQYLLETSMEEGMQLAPAAGWPDICQPFTHEVFDNGSFVRSLKLWPGSGDFCPLESLPEVLASIVLTAEDPTFYKHNGMDPFFLGYAVADNIAERKFRRGGSTVTMQLVRNLFLDHHKTVFRKLEEIMIALLLENVCRVPKSRILELYLNIIEFAPDIYGITEAAKYYFGKPPEMLNLHDCLVLSYIIPRPKFFMDAVAAGADQLRKNLFQHMEGSLRVLVGTGKVSEEEANAVCPSLHIRGYKLQLG